MIKSLSEFSNGCYAHRKKRNGKEIFETLEEHTNHTLKCFKNIIKENHMESIIDNLYPDKMSYDLLESVFLYHDTGKINPKFQTDKMKNPKPGASRIGDSNHSIYGAYIYLSCMMEKYISTILTTRQYNYLYEIIDNAYIISRHHASLKTKENFIEEIENLDDRSLLWFHSILQKNNIKLLTKERFMGETYIKIIKNALNDISNSLTEEPKRYYIKMRTTYSLLCCSDNIATHEFNSDCNFNYYDKLDYDNYFNAPLYQSINAYKNGLKTFSPNDINKLRSDIAIEVESVVNTSSSLMSLESPCGAGKTNTGLLAACTLLKNNNDLRGILYTSPFNAITDQNVSVFRQYFNDIQVINSTSVINQTDYSEYETERMVMDYQLNNFAFTATSHVHLFNILFGTRKEDLINLTFLSNKVIILDEIQAYTPSVWKNMFEMVLEYSKIYNFKVIFMSATLPALDTLSDFKDMTDLVPNKSVYFSHPIFKNRVDFSYIGKVERLKYLIKDSSFYINKKVLYEFIIKKTASEFYELIKEELPAKEIYLLDGDTSQPERQKIISRAKENIDIIIISTQVIEAGVDLDFDYGFKDSSIPDSEIQFLGRINRSCKRSGYAEFFDYDSTRLYKDDLRSLNNISDINIQEAIRNNDNIALYHSVLNQLKKLSEHKSDEYSYSMFLYDCLICNFTSIQEKMTLIKPTANIYIAYKLTMPDIFDDDGNATIPYYEYEKMSKHYNADLFCINGHDLILDGKKIYDLSKTINSDASLSYSTRFLYNKYVNVLKNYFTYSFYVNKNSTLQNICKVYENYYYTDDYDRYIVNNRINRQAFYQNSIL